MLTIPTINWVAVIVAAVAAMIVGGIWYSPMLFGNAWMRELGMKMTDMKKMQAKMAIAYLGGFIGALVMVLVLEMLVKWLSIGTFTQGAILGLVLWVGFSVPHHWMRKNFEGGSMKLFMIAAGHDFVAFAILCGILGFMG